MSEIVVVLQALGSLQIYFHHQLNLEFQPTIKYPTPEIQIAPQDPLVSITPTPALLMPSLVSCQDQTLKY